MSNPFGKDGGPVNSVPRNTFDLSFQNNLTCEFGGLYPVLCKEVLPGDSFKIDTTFGLRFMPTAFPLQTRIRAHIHYFYVRNRNLWKDWPDFFGKTKKHNIVFPTIGTDDDRFFSTGSLADYLGVPSTVYGSLSSLRNVNGGLVSITPETDYFTVDGVPLRWLDYDSLPPLPPEGSSLPAVLGPRPTPTTPHTSVFGIFIHEEGDIFSFSKGDVVRLVVTYSNPSNADLNRIVGNYCPFYFLTGSGIRDMTLLHHAVGKCVGVQEGQVYYDVTLDVPVTCRFVLIGSPTSLIRKSAKLQASSLTSFVDYPALENRPFTDNDYIEISALPFRAYESIYNSFYRDERNNPLVIDGEKEYNRYIVNDRGGRDSTPYQIRFRNWEQDFLTTAVPTPQQGDAPLVGISSAGVMSIQDTETGKIYQVMAKTADDADTIVGADIREDLPTSVMRSIVNYASSGISINDFRNVNAMQRWLETNIRRGFKYRDQIKSHFDVDVSYQELDMPEFLGGVSCDVTPSTVSQTSQDTSNNPLGSYAGQLYGSGGSNNSVSKYFDEHGFIIGIMSVVPVPNYSQLLPKHFLKTTDSLDYYTPEFGHIGLQPILNQEVAPLQTTDIDYSHVFGYQRAWYDYLQSVDEVHGQFRTDLRNFVMNRVFDNLPILGPSFTVIDPKQLNDVFTVREVDGKPVQPILGQIYFKISAKRPIPRYGVPRLE